MKGHGTLLKLLRPLPKHIGLKWVSQKRSALSGLSFVERASLLQLTPVYGKMSGSIVRSTCNSSFAPTTLKGVSRVHVVSGSFHIPIL